VKADIGIRGGRMWSIGEGGNPDIQTDVTMPIGAVSEVIAGEGMSVTAGGFPPTYARATASRPAAQSPIYCLGARPKKGATRRWPSKASPFGLRPC